jgi:hypothetical protein
MSLRVFDDGWHFLAHFCVVLWSMAPAGGLQRGQELVGEVMTPTAT